VQQHQREQAARFGLRQQLDEEPAEADRFRRQIVARNRGARRGGIPFVEDQIDDAEHRAEARRQLRRIRYAIRNLRVPDLGLRAHDPLRQRRGRCQERLRDFFRRQAADFAERQRDLGVRSERRVAAGEDQPQPVVLDGFLVRPGGRVFDRDLGDGAGLVELIEPGSAAHRVDRLEASSRDQPRARVRRDAVARPLLERCPEGVVERLLGRLEIAEQPDQGRQHTPGLGDIHRVHRFVNGVDRSHWRSIL
jgi:hypothetical protein